MFFLMSGSRIPFPLILKQLCRPCLLKFAHHPLNQKSENLDRSHNDTEAGCWGRKVFWPDCETVGFPSADLVVVAPNPNYISKYGTMGVHTVIVGTVKHKVVQGNDSDAHAVPDNKSFYTSQY